jgi:aryl carrier-like protein
MIPKEVITISAMPRTAPGKLDRRSVKDCAPDITDRKSSHGTVVDTTAQTSDSIAWPSPTTESNFDIIEPIWAKILRLESGRIDTESSWTDAGGDSLSAMMFVREARTVGYHLSSAELMSGMSLMELCDMVRQSDDNVAQPECTSGDMDHGSDGNSPATDFQRFYLSRSQSLGNDQLYKYDIVFRGGFDLTRLEEALNQWFQGTEALRLSFSSAGGEHIIQLVIDKHSTDWECRLRRHEDDDQLTAMSGGHDLIKHPVLVSLCQPRGSGTETVRLAIRIHHGIFDGLSWNLLLDDLVSAYQHGRLPTRPSFLGYLQNRLLQQLLESLEYWQQLLRDSTPTILRLSPKSSFYGAACASSSEHIISRAVDLEPDSRRKSTATMSTLVQAAWSIVLSAISGRNDVLFLYLVHGRDENVANSDQVIGCCVAECPLRIQLDKSMSIADLTGLVQK